MTTPKRIVGPRVAVALLVSASAGLAIAGYLTVTTLTGGLPACGLVGGCESVALSVYSEVLGVPVALLGFAFSSVLLAAVIGVVRGLRHALVATYALSLFGVVVVGYLSYLEVFVIRAICLWCVAYAALLVVVFLLSAVRLRSGASARNRE